MIQLKNETTINNSIIQAVC